MKVFIQPSNRKHKKLMAIFTDDDKTEIIDVIHFGDTRYEDYTIHHDEERKNRYIQRHQKNNNQNWDLPKTAGALSRWILWGPYKDVKKNIKYFKNKFDLN